jgi:hypothetical protein
MNDGKKERAPYILPTDVDTDGGAQQCDADPHVTPMLPNPRQITYFSPISFSSTVVSRRAVYRLSFDPYVPRCTTSRTVAVVLSIIIFCPPAPDRPPFRGVFSLR